MFQVCMISMACCEGVRRKAPMNYIFLGIFTGNFRLELVSCPIVLTSLMNSLRDLNLIMYREKTVHRSIPPQSNISVQVWTLPEGISYSRLTALHTKIRLRHGNSRRGCMSAVLLLCSKAVRPNLKLKTSRFSHVSDSFTFVQTFSRVDVTKHFWS